MLAEVLRLLEAEKAPLRPAEVAARLGLGIDEAESALATLAAIGRVARGSDPAACPGGCGWCRWDGACPLALGSAVR